MSQKLPTNGFKWVQDLPEFNEDFMKKYDENSYIGYFFEVDVEYPKRLFNLHKYLAFLSKKKKGWKIRKTYLWHRGERKICYSHKSFKTCIKSWVKTKKGTQSNLIYSKRLVKVIYWHEYWTKKKCTKWIWEKFL